MGALRAGLVLIIGLAIAQDTRPLEYRCWEMCSVLDMEYREVEGCTCVCKDVDGSRVESQLHDCP